MTVESLVAAARVRNAYTTHKHDGAGLFDPDLLAKQFQPLRWPVVVVDQAQLRLLQAIVLQARIDAKKN